MHKAILALIKAKDVKYVDLRFTDPRGKWQHVTFDLSQITEDTLTNGLMFDGSSIAGWRTINDSDMTLVPDCDAAVIDPFFAQTTLALTCDVIVPATGERYNRCPRSIARAAEQYLISSGIGDTAYFGPEAEFFIFDDVRYEVSMNKCFYQIDTIEGAYNSRNGIRSGQSRPPSGGQGRLLPGSAGGRLPGHSRRDALDHGRHGHQPGKAPPRSGRRAARSWDANSPP